MIKKFVKERLGLILFLLVFGGLAAWGAVSVGNAGKNAAKPEYEFIPGEANTDGNAEGSYAAVAGTERLELWFNEAKGTVQVRDLENGYLWKSVVDDTVYDTEKLNKQWEAYLKSVLTVSYNDLTQRDAPPVKLFSARDCDFIEAEALTDGVAVRYGFTAVGIYLTVEYRLTARGLTVSIPADGIEEQTRYVITSMELLPFFGAAGDEVNGYFVYPDGSGGITRYESAPERSSAIKAGMWRTYSNKTVSVQEMMNSENYERYSAEIPVYGVKNGENAFLAAFTKGAENSGIIGYPSGYVVNLNHIGFEIYTRNVFDVDMFSVSGDSGTVANGRQIQRVDRTLIASDREVTYFFLSGNEANYSKMAGVYRDYLIETGQLKARIADGETMPLALRFVMGVTRPQMIFDEYVKMTGVSDLIEILDRLKEKGITDTRTVLLSWLSDGSSYPDYWPPAARIGGKSGLKKLGEYLEENSGNRIYLDSNFNVAIEGNGGFSATKDVVYDGLNLPVSGGYDETWYLLNPRAAYERNLKFLNKLAGCANLGVGYSYLGRMVYPDYNEEAPYTREETVNQWKELLARTEQEGRRVAAAGMNQYLYESAEYLYEVNDGAFGLSITDASVPFVQMVISGLIPYSAGAGNLSYDIRLEMLKWIEYGALPGFILTCEDAVNLKETDYDYVFTSTYDKWEDRVAQVYLELKENLGHVYGKQMISHEILGKNIVRIEYDTGTAIYLNYNETQAEADGIAIPAKGYVVKEAQE